MAEKKEKKAAENKPDIDLFVTNKLKAINEMDGRRAKFLAERVLANKRGKK